MLDVVYEKVSVALFGAGKPVHPMAEIKRAKKLISELPAYDAALALEELTFWLDSVTHAEGFKLGFRFELLDLLDRAAKTYQRKLAYEYLADDRHEKLRANKLWTPVFESWKMLGNAYIRCVEQFQSGARGASQKLLPVIVARALRALTVQLKWLLQRYGPVDDRIWGDLGRLYQFAETQDIATAVIEIYPGAHGKSTVQREFLKAMMLRVSSTDGLTPLEQEIAERTVAHLGDMYSLQAEPAPGSNHFFDLSACKQPMRVFEGVESNRTVRFFSAGAALPALEQLIQQVNAEDSVPPYIDLGGNFEAGLVLPVMQHLALYWSDNPPARGSERRKIAARITVVRTFKQMLKNILPAADDNSLDFRPRDGSESWVIANVSDGGFGAIVPPLKGDWVRIGSVLGVQTETTQQWAAGVVRRISRDELQQRNVGIQLISDTVIAVTLLSTGDGSALSSTREEHPAVLLSTVLDKNSEIDLLLPARSFILDHQLEMNVRGKRYCLIPSELVEVGENFDWARFKVM